MDIPMRCPRCGKRVFDTSAFHQTDSPVEITLKCPHCNQFVRVPLAPSMSLPGRKGGSRQLTVA